MFEDRTLNLSYYHSKNVTPELKRNDMGAFADQHSTIMQVRNETRFSIALVSRAGIRTILPPARGLGRFPGTFLVRVCNSPTTGIISYVDDQFSAGLPAPDIETEVWKKAIVGKPPEVTTAIRAAQAVHESSVVHQIHEQDILSNAGCLYVANLDLVLAVVDGSGKQPPPHPYSRLGSIATVHELTAANFGLTGAAYAVKIVDRRAVFGDRFVNFGGRIVHVRAEKRVTANVMDGVYLTTNAPSTGITQAAQYETEMFSFEDADSLLPIYRTRDAAETLGKPEEVMRRQIEIERQTFERQKIADATAQLERRAEIAAEQDEFDRRRREHEERIARKQEELDERREEFAKREHFHREKEQQFKTDQLFAKHKLEERSDARKVLLDVVKFVPAIIGGAVAVYATVKKFSKA